MNKIGILTFFRSINYGACLQGYALYKYLKNNQKNVEMINYLYKAGLRNNFFDIYKEIVKNTKNDILKPLRILYSLRNIRYSFNNEKVKLFDKFINDNMNISNKVTNKEEINKLNYNTIIIGSDQVWNDKLFNRFDNIFFGIGLISDNMVSYAASLGKSVFEKENEEIIKNSLLNFSAISVREKNNINYLSCLLNKDIDYVIDPTFLLNKCEYDYLADKYKLNIKNKYILIYSLGYIPELIEIAEKINKNINNKIIIVELYSHGHKDKRYKYLNNVGPGEFLYLIKNAEYVITNSFHGTALSIILEKEFYSFITSKGERLKNILKIADLRDRLVNNTDNFNQYQIDYNIVKNNLKNYIYLGKEYLDKNVCNKDF